MVTLLGPQAYYAQVFDRLERAFRGCHYVVATGQGLVERGFSPDFPIAVEPVSQLRELAVHEGLQLHLPVIGERSAHVLMPLDIEVFLAGDNHLLYSDPASHRHWFECVAPVIHFLRDFLEQRKVPHLLDYTPSGAHFLWRVPCRGPAGDALASIGFVEDDLARACEYVDPGDIKRQWGVSLDAARIFSGLGKIAEYLLMHTMRAFHDDERVGRLPVTLADSESRCINFDASWAEGAPFMRSIRSPFSLHAKNREKYGQWHRPPLVDVIGSVFDGRVRHGVDDIDDIEDIATCMWSLKEAASRARAFSGYIPEADASLVALVNEYRASDLMRFHQDFEDTEELPRGQALQRARADSSATEAVHEVLRRPNPLALQPTRMKGLVADLVIEAGWKPRHVANLLRDLYIDPSHGWHIDFFKCPAEEKANFWARAFGAIVHRSATGT